jgi:PAS domain S-box-containing protein
LIIALAIKDKLEDIKGDEQMKREISYEEIERDVADFKKVIKSMKESRKQIIKTMEVNESKIEKGLSNLIENVEFQATELRKKEEELKRSNEFNRLLIENVPAMVWMADKEGKCCLINKEFTRLLGWKKEEVLGKLSSDSPYVCESGLPYIEEGTVEALSKIWKRTIEKKELAIGEVPFITKDGRIVVHQGIEIPYGKRKARLWASTDITELRKREEELKKAQEYTKTLLYSIPNPTSILDLDGRRIYTAKSSEDYFRMPRDKILGAKVEDFYVKENIKKIREALERGKRGYSSCEATCMRGDGTKFPVILSFAPVKDKDGNLINIAFSATDVTELRKREEELNQTLSACREVVEGVAQKGDLNARIDVSELAGKHKIIGVDINLMIDSLQNKIEEIREREAETKEARAYAEVIIADIADPL